jgi:RNA polymerase sigma-70 factor (ECF subfamily)
MVRQTTSVSHTNCVTHLTKRKTLDDNDSAQVAEAVGRSPAAVRQLAHRAHAHVQATAPRLRVDPAEHDQVVTAFLAAVRAGDLAALTAALDPDVVLTSDGGGAVSAARRPVHGPDHVARLILSITSTTAPEIQLLTVNDSTGLALSHDGELYALISLTTGAGVERVDIVLNPDKLPRQRSS